MFAALRRIAPAIAAASLALAATAGCAQPAPDAPAAAAQAPRSAPLIGEGPGGRTALTSWTLALDASNRGLAKGWQRGDFAGRTVSVPNVVDATAIKGAAGWRNYEGAVAWYRTTFSAPRAGTYALSFASANFRASVFIDGHAAATHLGLIRTSGERMRDRGAPCEDHDGQEEPQSWSAVNRAGQALQRRFGAVPMSSEVRITSVSLRGLTTPRF